MKRNKRLFKQQAGFDYNLKKGFGLSYNTGMTTQQEIEETERKLAELKEKLKLELDKSEWIYIPELKIEVQSKIHHFNKTLSESMKDLKKGESVITYEQIQWMRNSKYAKMLNLIDTWEFVYPNPDKISEKNGYVAGFVVDSDWAVLGCYWNPISIGASLGVRFVRKKGRKNNDNNK